MDIRRWKVMLAVSDAGSYTRAANHQSIYTSDVPSIEVVGTKSDRLIAHYVTYRLADGWTEVNYFVNLDAAQNVNFLFYNLQLNDAFADFSINLCQRALDDREVRNLYNQWTAYVNAAGENAQDDGGFMEYYELFGAFLEDPNVDPENLNQDDPNAIQNLMDLGGNEALASFLDANSVDVSKYLRNFTFDNGSYSGWTVTGDRWRVVEPTGNFTTQHMRAEYPGNYTLPEGQLSQSYNLPAGKYVYVLQAQANKYYIDGRGGSNNQQIMDWYNSEPHAHQPAHIHRSLLRHLCRPARRREDIRLLRQRLGCRGRWRNPPLRQHCPAHLRRRCS